jgi:hypothetical protein
MSGIQMIMAATPAALRYWYGNGGANTYQGDQAPLVDPQGNIYRAGSYTYDFTYGYARCFIVKYDKDGNQLWGSYYGSGTHLYTPLMTFDSPTSPSFIYCVAGNSSSNFAFLMKISIATGAVSWAKRISGSNSWTHNGIAVSGSNVYVVGQQYSVGWIVRYDTSGNLQNYQNYTYNNRNNSVNFTGCAPAPSGDVYVMGNWGNSYNVFWMRLTSALSSPTWQVNGGTYVNTQLQSMRSNANGDFYWANRGSNGSIRAGKRNSSGGEIWSRTLQPSNFNEQQIYTDVFNIYLGAGGELYVAGYSNFGRSDSNARYFTVKLNNDGSTGFVRGMYVMGGQGETLQINQMTVCETSNGYLQIPMKPSTNTRGYLGALNLPTDGSKTGTYFYPSNTYYIYEGASVSVSTLTLDNNNPGISTYSVSMSDSGQTPSTGSFGQTITPVLPA